MINLPLDLGTFTTAVSIISAIVYITMYITTLDKRIAVVESGYTQTESKLDTITGFQNQQIQQFESDIKMQITEINTQLKQIYSILLDAKKRETT